MSSPNKISDQPHVSVVIPALNEAGSVGTVIADTLTAFSLFDITGEIIVVNDGSVDETGEIVEGWAAQKENVRLISHALPEGIGKSFMDGSRIAKGKFLTMLPGDNENIPDETLKLLAYTENCDAIVPFVENSEIRGPFRQFISKLFTAIINISFFTDFRYTNGTNIYRTDLFRELDIDSSGFFYQTEILIKLHRKDAVVRQVPYRISGRTVGDNKAISFKSFIAVAKDYLRLMQFVWIAPQKQKRVEP